MSTKTKFSLLIVIGFFIVGFYIINSNSNRQLEKKIQYVTLGGEKIRVDLAITPEDQARGLGGRDSLKIDEGMLFVFDKPEKHYFWMKDMNFAIDIIWLDGDRNIIYIKKDAKPDALLPNFGPDEDSSYVLEVKSGFAEKYNLKEEDKVEFGF